MAKPTLVYKFATEGNPFGEKIITNVAEVVAWMRAGIGDGAPIPEASYVTESNVTCEKQIVNLTEVVQWMYDNWQGEKGVAPVLDYATVGVKPFGVISMRNLSEVVEAIFNQMSGDEPAQEPEWVYTKVNLEDTPVPFGTTKYFVKNGEEYVLATIGGDGTFPVGVDIYTRKNASSGVDMDDQWDESEMSYVLVDKSTYTVPAEHVVYYVKNEDEYVPGGVNEDGDAWADPDEEVYVHV